VASNSVPFGSVVMDEDTDGYIVVQQEMYVCRSLIAAGLCLSDGRSTLASRGDHVATNFALKRYLKAST
jgi:hypothetical protein